MEKRESARFEIEAPAKIFVGQGLEAVIEGVTRDISAKGAFLICGEVVPQGEQLELRMVLSVGRTLGNAREAEVSTRAIVVRTERSGIAVRFAGKRNIRPISNN